MERNAHDTRDSANVFVIVIGGCDDALTDSARRLAVMLSMRLHTSVVELKNMPMEELLLICDDIAFIDKRRDKDGSE